MHTRITEIIGKIGKLYKRRRMEIGERGIYLQDTELTETLLQPKSKIECDLSDGIGFHGSEMKVFLARKGKLSVSKRKRKTHINPVIDIRRKAILADFSKYKYVEADIYGDEVVIRGFDDINESKIVEDLIESRKNSENKCKILDITKRLELKREIKLSRQYVQEVLLAKASGDTSYGYEQMTFDYMWDNFAEVNQSVNATTSTITKSRYKEDLGIAMNMISFCSGAGVLDKGFIDQGFEGLLAMDIEEDMVKTYNANLGNHAIVADLSTYDFNNLPKDKQPKIIVAGSPCQDLSNANRVTGKILDSEKNLLIRKIIDAIKHLPSLDVFVIENVPQLLTKGKKFVDEIKERLSDFEITINKVNSGDFGSAQLRERAIIIGSKIGKIELKAPPVRLYKTVRQAFAGLTNETPNQLDYTKSGEEVQRRMSYVTPGGNFKDIPEELRGKGVHSNSYRRLEWDKPSITIANPRKSCLMPPEGNRILSVRECARLFDLPDNFKFLGKLASMQQMIANAVPLALSTAIAKQVKSAFINHYGERCKFTNDLVSMA